MFLGEPNVTGASCPALRVNLALRVSADSLPSSAPLAVAGTARLRVGFGAIATFKAGGGRRLVTSDALFEAKLCVRQVGSVELTMRGAAPWLTSDWVRAWLTDTMPHGDCFDITSLVYVLIQRGGTITPPPAP